MRSRKGSDPRLPQARSLAGLLVGALLLAACGSAPPSESMPTQVADLEPLAGRKVVLMKPDIELFVIHSGGIPELNAGWTTSARKGVAEFLDRRLSAKKMTVISAEQVDAAREDDPLAVQLVRLQSAVAQSILASHFKRFDRLPTKEERFEWSLGSEARVLAQRYQADYALFVAFREHYPSEDATGPHGGSLSRRFAVLSLYRKGYAMLVELESGRVVWFAERDRISPGLRTSGEVRATLDTLLENFPG